jgi:hypothetical protein
MRSTTARNAAEILSPGKDTLHNTSLRITESVLRCYAKSGGRCGLVEALERGPRLPLGQLDDPSFNAPIYANLVHDEGAETCRLIWCRPNRREGEG